MHNRAAIVANEIDIHLKGSSKSSQASCTFLAQWLLPGIPHDSQPQEYQLHEGPIHVCLSVLLTPHSSARYSRCLIDICQELRNSFPLKR